VTGLERSFAAYTIFRIFLDGFAGRLKSCPEKKQAFRAGPTGRRFVGEFGPRVSPGAILTFSLREGRQRDREFHTYGTAICGGIRTPGFHPGLFSPSPSGRGGSETRSFIPTGRRFVGEFGPPGFTRDYSHLLPPGGAAARQGVSYLRGSATPVDG